jgi:hypothetical protein
MAKGSVTDFESVESLIKFINEYKGKSVPLVAKKLKRSKSGIYKMLNGDIKKPDFDVLRELKKMADVNYRKVN